MPRCAAGGDPLMQITGAWTLDLDRLVEQLADAIAERVLARLREPAGSTTYEREPQPERGVGRRRGVEFGAVPQDRPDTVEYDDEKPRR
ncbi:MAG TPA: hypothetical protein VFE09_07475 [Rubrobacteraceae bacterium]|nr:hypothetical protein [Rubrobacteraceae bacterium]